MSRNTRIISITAATLTSVAIGLTGALPAHAQTATPPAMTPAPQGLDEIDIRQRLARMGYSQVREVRFISHLRDDHFIAIAQRRGVWYELKIDDDHGRILRVRRTR